MPLQRRVPKRGFTNIFKTIYQLVNVKDLDRFPAGTEVNMDALLDSGLIKKTRLPVKLLGDGKVEHAVTVVVHKCSKNARELVEKAGGTIKIID